MADRVLSALVKVRIEESGTRADQKLLDDYRLNDEGRNARQAETYSFEERALHPGSCAMRTRWAI